MHDSPTKNECNDKVGKHLLSTFVSHCKNTFTTQTTYEKVVQAT